MINNTMDGHLCHKDEETNFWNKSGSTGPTGPNGPTGPTRPTGPKGSKIEQQLQHKRKNEILNISEAVILFNFKSSNFIKCELNIAFCVRFI